MIPDGDVPGSAAGAPNPYAQFGLNADGTSITPAAPAAPDAAALAGKVTGLESQLTAMKAENATLAEQGKLLQRLTKALTGETALPDPGNEKIWGELRGVIKQSSPAFARLLDAVEKDPDVLDRLSRGQEALAAGTVATLNTSAHEAVMTAAQGFFKGYTKDELGEAVLPFENVITDMINKSPQLRARFLSGESGAVSKELFERLLKPHAAARIRDKQARLKGSSLPTPTPRGSAGTGAASPDTTDESKTPMSRQVDDKGKRKFDLKSPQGRASFHKTVINRYLDGRNARNDD